MRSRLRTALLLSSLSALGCGGGSSGTGPDLSSCTDPKGSNTVVLPMGYVSHCAKLAGNLQRSTTMGDSLAVIGPLTSHTDSGYVMVQLMLTSTAGQSLAAGQTFVATRDTTSNLVTGPGLFSIVSGGAFCVAAGTTTLEQLQLTDSLGMFSASFTGDFDRNCNTPDLGVELVTVSAKFVNVPLVLF
jgi:hypothetical protein